MSIIIHIPRIQTEDSINNKTRQADLESVNLEEQNEVISINLPKYKQAKANDLSKFEVSICSSKYTLSGDEMTSNLSFDSNVFPNSNRSHYNDVEKELEIENKNIKYITTPVKKKSESNYFHNYENNKSERVIYEEINKAEQMNENKKFIIY